MRRLILMRHGKTVPSVPAGDHARPLNPRGIAQAAEAGERLSRQAPPDFALVSDARRTRETFDQLVEAIGRDVPHRFEPRLYGASAEEILGVVAPTFGTVRTLLVVGHNPGLGDLARRLARHADEDARAALDAHFPTSCFAVIALDGEGWSAADQGGTLDAFVTPSSE